MSTSQWQVTQGNEELGRHQPVIHGRRPVSAGAAQDSGEGPHRQASPTHLLSRCRDTTVPLTSCVRYQAGEERREDGRGREGGGTEDQREHPHPDHFVDQAARARQEEQREDDPPDAALARERHAAKVGWRERGVNLRRPRSSLTNAGAARWCETSSRRVSRPTAPAETAAPHNPAPTSRRGPEARSAGAT